MLVINMQKKTTLNDIQNRLRECVKSWRINILAIHIFCIVKKNKITKIGEKRKKKNKRTRDVEDNVVRGKSITTLNASLSLLYNVWINIDYKLMNHITKTNQFYCA